MEIFCQRWYGDGRERFSTEPLLKKDFIVMRSGIFMAKSLRHYLEEGTIVGKYFRIPSEQRPLEGVGSSGVYQVVSITNQGNLMVCDAGDYLSERFRYFDLEKCLNDRRASFLAASFASFRFKPQEPKYIGNI